MPRIKFDVDGVGVAASEGAQIYDGPPPPRGVYEVQVNYAGFKVIKGEKSKNKGKQRLNILYQVTDGKYKGATIRDGLNMTNDGIPYVNAFLHAFTYGKPEQKLKMEKAMWVQGPIVDDKGRVLQIGPVRFTAPKGEEHIFRRPTLMVSSILRKNNQTGEMEANVAGYLNQAEAKAKREGVDVDDDDDDVVEEALPDASDEGEDETDPWDDAAADDGGDADADAGADSGADAGDDDDPFTED